MMPISKWEISNGSPNRTWRYMTDIYNPHSHWWQYCGKRPLFITITNEGIRGDLSAKWIWRVYDNGKVVSTFRVHTLAYAKSSAIAHALNHKWWKSQLPAGS